MNQQLMPPIQQWHQLESSRLLLEPRKQVLSVLFRLLATVTLIFRTPLVVVAVWTLLIFGANAWIRYLIVAYRTESTANPNKMTMTSTMSQITQRFKIVWLCNSFIWSMLIFISQVWLPSPLRILCIAILNSLMFLSLTRTYVDRVFMHQVSVTFIVSQLLFLVFSFELSLADAMLPERAAIYTVYLLLTAYLLWLVGNRFNHTHKLHMDADYVKLQLIETLNQSKAQLRLEQQALVASNSLVQQFYSGAAHDLRQPVYAMQLYTAMLAEDPSQNTYLLPKITQSCIAINDMFNALFDYQQTHMHDNDLVEKDINIQDTFRSLALHFQPIASGKGLQIRFKPIQGYVTMVPLYLVRILSNLIANALRYTSTGGVLVSARKTHSGLRFEIWDTGIGIDEANLTKIFTEFYKINTNDNNAGLSVEEPGHAGSSNEGLGLGLSIVKQLSARLDKTDISVKSRLGRGSVFIFNIPLERYVAA
jgi:signal transduction histidine kinase